MGRVKLTEDVFGEEEERKGRRSLRLLRCFLSFFRKGAFRRLGRSGKLRDCSSMKRPALASSESEKYAFNVSVVGIPGDEAPVLLSSPDEAGFQAQTASMS